VTASAEPRKLLVLTSTLPRWLDDTEPRFVEYLSYELARSFDVVVLAPHCPGAARQETLSNGKQSLAIHRFRYFIPALQSLAYDGGILSRIRGNPLRLLLVPFFLVAQLYAIVSLHRRYRFDAIHAHWIIPQGLVVATFRRLLRQAPPVLVTSHGGDLFALRGAVMGRLKHWIIATSTAVTVVSEAMRSYCDDLGFDAAKITVRSMGVDLRTTFTPGESPVQRRGLIFVGRLVEKKGVTFLIEAMALLAERYPDLRLTIVGAGPDRQSIVRLTKQHKLQENVRLVGSVLNVQLPDYLRAAQIAVMPSVVAASGDQEGLGLVAIEAMGCGCAVVASDLPAIRDSVLDGQTGLMARPADAQDLAEKIGELLADDHKRQTLAENGRRYAVENFDWRTVGDDYADLITGMLEPAAS
jgi:glycosyltransferase involved in cell wall biosynthesis